MSNYPTRLRTLLRLTFLLSCWLQTVSAADNITVEDTDSSIAYLPAASWHASSNLCTSCLNPGSGTSFHEGIHEGVTGNDDDDGPKSSKSTPAATSSPPATATGNTNSGDDKGKNKGSRRSLMGRVLVPQPRSDTDDVGDPDVRISFNFTGTAVYVFGILPPAVMNANATSPNMNLSFWIDNTLVADNKFPASSPSTFTPGLAVFSTSSLSEGPHQLVIRVGQNSTFIFQHLLYTPVAAVSSSTSTSAPSSTSPIAQDAPSPTIDPKTKKHNIATFGGAVGGSAGVLGVFALGLAFSIIRRRRQAARRERLDRESLHTNASDDSPMSGPAPFVPRYFPDTVIPPDPPTYMTALATNHNNSTLLASLSGSAYASTDRSYADIPPSTPPPPMEEIALLPPPPPFPVAVTAPPPGSLASSSENTSPPSIAEGAPSDSHSAVPPVGTTHSTSAIAPELVPLLQTVESESPALAESAPRSRTAPSSLSSSNDDDLAEAAEPDAAEGSPLRGNAS